jgi:hypothetical protein
MEGTLTCCTTPWGPALERRAGIAAQPRGGHFVPVPPSSCSPGTNPISHLRCLNWPVPTTVLPLTASVPTVARLLCNRWPTLPLPPLQRGTLVWGLHHRKVAALVLCPPAPLQQQPDAVPRNGGFLFCIGDRRSQIRSACGHRQTPSTFGASLLHLSLATAAKSKLR